MRCVRIALAACLAAGTAQAADLRDLPAGALSDDWIVTLRAKALASPDYPGAKRLGFFAYPSLSIRKASSPATFSAPDDNISLALYDAGWLKAGPVGRFVSARRISEHRALFGLRDVGWTVELGGFVEVWPTENLRGRVEVRHGVRGHADAVASVSADWVQRWERFTFSVGPRLSVVGNRYAGKYFSVSPWEAAFNGRVRPFTARGGLEAAGVTAAATYQWSNQWAATAFVRYERLIGDAGRSPVPGVLGARDQVTVGGNVAYTFAMQPLFRAF